MFASRTLSLFVRRATSTEAAAASEAVPAVTGPSKRPNLVEMMMEKPYKGVVREYILLDGVGIKKKMVIEHRGFVSRFLLSLSSRCC